MNILKNDTSIVSLLKKPQNITSRQGNGKLVSPIID